MSDSESGEDGPERAQQQEDDAGPQTTFWRGGYVNKRAVSGRNLLRLGLAKTCAFVNMEEIAFCCGTLRAYKYLSPFQFTIPKFSNLFSHSAFVPERVEKNATLTLSWPPPLLLLWVLLFAVVTPGAVRCNLSSAGTNTSETPTASVRGAFFYLQGFLFCPLAKTMKVVYTLNFPKTALGFCRTGTAGREVVVVVVEK